MRLIYAIVLTTLMLAAFLMPAQAQECAHPFDATVARLLTDPNVTEGKASIRVVPDEKLVDFLAALEKGLSTDITVEVTRALVLVTVEGTVNVGLEVDGCLLPPITVLFPLNASFSGRLPDGRITA